MSYGNNVWRPARFSIHLTDEAAEALRKRAASEQRKPGNLASKLLDDLLREVTPKRQGHASGARAQ